MHREIYHIFIFKIEIKKSVKKSSKYTKFNAVLKSQISVDVITAFFYHQIRDHNETEKNKMGVFYLTDYGAVKSVAVLTDIYIQY